MPRPPRVARMRLEKEAKSMDTLVMQWQMVMLALDVLVAATAVWLFVES